MSAKMRAVGLLKTYWNGEAERTVESGRSVRETLTEEGIPPEVVALVMVINAATQVEEMQSKDYVLQEGDVIKVIAVVGGG